MVYIYLRLVLESPKASACNNCYSNFFVTSLVNEQLTKGKWRE